MITIEIFGPGCRRCQATAQAVRQAVQKAGIEATITEIHDPREMAQARVVFTPAVRVNGVMRCLGRVPEAVEVAEWLAETGGKAA